MAKQKQSLDYIALRSEYVKLAKRADQRLVRLEQLETKPGFENVTKYAYAWAQKNLKRWSGKSEGSRFNAAIPSNMKSLEAKLHIVKQFLDMQTSTKGGILKTYKKRAQTINEKYGTSFTWQQLSIYFNSGLAKKADKEIGSDTALKLIAEMQRRRDEVIEAIKESNEQTLILTDRETIAEEVSNFLAKHGTELLEIL